jgi:hypothetical protein
MTDVRIQEGDFAYIFPAGSTACKYDSWSHYRNRFTGTCGGAKAVDLAHAQSSVLWLVEAKDYRHHHRTKPSELPQEIAEKVRDTLVGLISARMHADQSEERQAAEQFLRCSRIRIAVHLEQRRSSSGARRYPIDPASVLQKLKTLTKWIDCHPTVFQSNNVPVDAPFRIE